MIYVPLVAFVATIALLCALFGIPIVIVDAFLFLLAAYVASMIAMYATTTNTKGP
jgi:hypothetical protein